jgi:hypothetical protein
MPKGARGSRGKSKGKPNPVRLGIEVIKAPVGITKQSFNNVLIKSIDTADKKLPKGFIVKIRWSNDGGKTTRSDEWSNALIDSATYGRGWDELLKSFLRSH